MFTAVGLNQEICGCRFAFLRIDRFVLSENSTAPHGLRAEMRKKHKNIWGNPYQSNFGPKYVEVSVEIAIFLGMRAVSF